MKKSFIPAAIAIIAVFTAVSASIVRVNAMAQKQECIRYTGVGPAVAEGVDVDKLPERARDFIGRHIRDCEVSYVDKEFDSGIYEVYMTDGIEVDFNARGDFQEIEAPVGYVLTKSLVRELIPAKSYKELIEMDCINNVAAIIVDSNGYNIDFAGVDLDSALFDMTGKLVALYE